MSGGEGAVIQTVDRTGPSPGARAVERQSNDDRNSPPFSSQAQQEGTTRD